MRVIRDIDRSNADSLKVQAHINDVYVRPAGNGDGTQLEKIANSMLGIVPSIAEHIKRKEAEKEHTDTMAGVALYHLMGKDMPFEDIKKEIQNRQTFKEGALKLTRAVKNGYFQESHRTAGFNFVNDMREWQNKGVTKDKDGNEIALTSIEDTEELMRVYREKESEVLHSYIGGGFDPKYYGEFIQPIVDATAQNFLERQANARAEILLDKQSKSFGEAIGAYIGMNIKNNEFILDDTQITPQVMASHIKQLSDEAQANGLPEHKVNNELTNMLRSVMYDYDIDNIDGLKEVAKLLPIWNDPQQRGIIEQSAKNAVEGKIRSDRDKEYAKKLENEKNIGTAFTELLKKYDYEPSGIPWAEWKNILAIAPDAVEHVATLQSAFNRLHETSVGQEYSIPDDEFYRLYGDFASGRRGLSSLAGLAGKASPQQLKELSGAYSSRLTLVKQSNGGSSAGKSSLGSGSYDKVKSKAIKLLSTGKDSMSYEEKVLIENVAGQIAYNVARQAQSWKQKNKDADDVDYSLTVDNLVTDNVSKYGANLELYRTHPDMLHNDPVDTRKKSLSNDARSLIEFFPKKNPTVRTMLERIENSKGKVSFSKQEIKEVNKLLKGTQFEGKAENIISRLVDISRELDY